MAETTNVTTSEQDSKESVKKPKETKEAKETKTETKTETTADIKQAKQAKMPTSIELSTVDGGALTYCISKINGAKKLMGSQGAFILLSHGRERTVNEDTLHLVLKLLDKQDTIVELQGFDTTYYFLKSFIEGYEKTPSGQIDVLAGGSLYRIRDEELEKLQEAMS